MPLLDHDRVRRFRKALQNRDPVLHESVRLPEAYFRPGQSLEADLLFAHSQGGAGWWLLVDEDIAYLGPDPLLLQAFTAKPANGWRPIVQIASNQAERILGIADRIFGLDGQPPGLPVKQDEIPPVRHGPLQHGPDLEDVGAPETGRFGVNLVDEARAGHLQRPMFRDDEIHALIRILCKEGKHAAVLLGEAGTGKTAIVEGFAIAIAEGQVPPDLASASILDVNLSFVAAGASHANEFEGRIKQLLDRARDDSNLILFLDELHTIRTSGSDASQMVKADLGRGRIRCIGATTSGEYRILQQDEALIRRFQEVPVRELTPVQAIEVLRARRERLEQHHGVSIPDELVRTVVELSARYVPHRQLPDKAIDLLDEACAGSRLKHLPASPTAPVRSADQRTYNRPIEIDPVPVDEPLPPPRPIDGVNGE